MKIDTNSHTWRALETYLQERLAKCRARNDSDKLDALGTAKLRGEIAALKDLLALPMQVAQVDADHPGYGADLLDT